VIPRAAKEGSPSHRCPAKRRWPRTRRRPCTRKLASGGPARRPHPPRGITRRKSLKALAHRAPDRWRHGKLTCQWEDDTWADATSGAGIYQNVWRWLEPATGRYTRPDPLQRQQGKWPENSFGYTTGNPIVFKDPRGLARRWYAPGVVYNGWHHSVCAILGEGECSAVKSGHYSNPLDDADFILVPATCKWVKISVGVATTREDGTLYLPPSSRWTGGGREATEAENQAFDNACNGNCECEYCKP
jgi:RHS repeat-associated protein